MSTTPDTAQDLLTTFGKHCIAGGPDDKMNEIHTRIQIALLAQMELIAERLRGINIAS